MRRFTVMLLGMIVCALAIIVHAAPTTKPSSTTKPAGPRLFGPYEKMSSLSSEQRDKIHEIHRKFLADQHDLEHKEMDDISALLNDDQKKELQEIQDKASADAKSRSTAKKDGSTSGER
jgi:Spy/CpxP family protein refolding chaperone